MDLPALLNQVLATTASAARASTKTLPKENLMVAELFGCLQLDGTVCQGQEATRLMRIAVDLRVFVFESGSFLGVNVCVKK